MKPGGHHPNTLAVYFKAWAFISEFRRASYSEIMKHCGWKSQASVILFLKYLESLGYIEIIKPESGYNNFYRIKVSALYGVVDVRSEQA